ncbi:MAG: hypothetical protein DMG25_06660 [Acidobacteria bacterium]|nr:MAG: hypothetical protein DMG25_06660 [Acidobacteriota bacterium]
MLYFDIDGAILDYEDRVKAGFLSGVLEAELRRAGFDRLICVSGWSDIFQEPVLRIPVSQRGAFLHKKIAAAFRDSDWFLRLLVLTTDTDNRCRGIDLAADGYYMDDRADEYFVNAHGPQAFEVEQGRRVLPVDPFSDGSDVLDWLKTIPAPSVFCRLPAEL